jgi:hypothetical protein
VKANVTATLLWENTAGERTPLVFGGLNGKPTKPALAQVAELRPEMTELGRGGALIVELTFKYRGAAKDFDPRKMRVAAIDVELEHDGGAVLALLGLMPEADDAAAASGESGDDGPLPLPEDGGADADERGALGDGDLEVSGGAHR